jgi:hypothetical protein
MTRYQVTIFERRPEPTVFYVNELSPDMPVPGVYTTEADKGFVVAIKEVEEDAKDTILPDR